MSTRVHQYKKLEISTLIDMLAVATQKLTTFLSRNVLDNNFYASKRKIRALIREIRRRMLEINS